MAIPLLCLIFATQKALPQELGRTLMLPPPQRLVVGPTETWTIKQIPTPREGEPDYPGDKPARVRVGGKVVIFQQDPDYPWFSVSHRGRDRSLVIRRGDGEGISWKETIWYGGKEGPELNLGIDAYRDRRNYAGSVVRDVGPRGMPYSAPEATLVQNGVARRLGWGRVVHWGEDGTIVLDVPVDAAGKPSGSEMTEDVVTRIVTPKGTVAVRGMRFLGQEPDGTVVLRSGGTGLANGYVPLNAKRPAGQAVVRVRGGRAVSFWELPPQWRAVGLSPAGWALLRKAGELPPPPRIDPGAIKAEELMKQMEENSDRELDATERVWTAGVLQNGRLRPVAFPRPPQSERLLWRDGAETLGTDAFRFTAFYGQDERTYLVAPMGRAHPLKARGVK